MKFMKTAVAVAIAGIAAAPMIASANTTLSGAVQMQLKGSDDDTLQADGKKVGDARFGTGDVLFGISTNHTLNNGLTGYGSLRWDIDNFSGTNTATADSVYVGVKGGFGDIRWGETPHAYEYAEMGNDIFGIGAGTNQALSYTGNFGGATVGLNWSPVQNEDTLGAGVKFNAGGFTIAVGVQDQDEEQAVAVGAAFAFAGASVGAHFATEGNGDLDDTTIASVKVGYAISGVSIGLTFATKQGQAVVAGTPAVAAVVADPTATPPVVGSPAVAAVAGSIGDADDTAIRLDLGYDLGGNMNISTRVTAFTGDTELTEWRIQLSKSF